MKVALLAVGLAVGLAACHGTLPPLEAIDLGGGDLTGDDGGLPFGAPCLVDTDCATGHCFMGASKKFCSMPCAQATAATDCPSPPTSGTCNMRGFCRP